MKIHVLSDLHLEFSDFAMPNVDADVRVFAGDVHTKERGIPFISANTGEIPALYVAGNHEFYGTAIPKLYDKMRRMASGTPVTVLENDAITIGDVRFFGCTLWTDFELHGPDYREIAMLEAKATMTDYKKIRLSPSYRKMTPGVAYGFHLTSLTRLKAQLSTPFAGKTAVITHHAPSAHSVVDTSELINSAYCSNLDDFISKNPIDLWIHGHTHRCVDYRIGETRVLSNQRGYPSENTGSFDPALVVSL